MRCFSSIISEKENKTKQKVQTIVLPNLTRILIQSSQDLNMQYNYNFSKILRICGSKINFAKCFLSLNNVFHRLVLIFTRNVFQRVLPQFLYIRYLKSCFFFLQRLILRKPKSVPLDSTSDDLLIIKVLLYFCQCFYKKIMISSSISYTFRTLRFL